MKDPFGKHRTTQKYNVTTDFENAGHRERSTGTIKSLGQVWIFITMTMMTTTTMMMMMINCLFS
jgi:hypothetical protein